MFSAFSIAVTDVLVTLSEVAMPLRFFQRRGTEELAPFALLFLSAR